MIKKIEKKSADETSKKGLLERVETSLKKEGVTLFENDGILEDYLRLPADLTVLEGSELGKYFTVFTKQKMYVRTMLARTNALVREVKEELDVLKEEVFSSLPAKMSVAEKNLNLRKHPKALELLDKLAFYEEKLNMLSMYLESLSEGIFAISREISRRESDWDEEKRENNISKKKSK